MTISGFAPNPITTDHTVLVTLSPNPDGSHSYQGVVDNKVALTFTLTYVAGVHLLTGTIPDRPNGVHKFKVKDTTAGTETPEINITYA